MLSIHLTPIRSFARRCFALGVCLVIGAMAPAPVTAGDSTPVAELRIYPSGQIVGVGLQRDFGKFGQGSVELLYNRARRGSSGRHADERGGGFGVGASYDHFSSAERLGWSLEGRADVFALGIDFRDGEKQGHSDVFVFQPTVGVGYTMPIVGDRWSARFGVDLGAEVNVRTRGAAVGKGAILLLGVRLSSR